MFVTVPPLEVTMSASILFLVRDAGGVTIKSNTAKVILSGSSADDSVHVQSSMLVGGKLVVNGGGIPTVILGDTINTNDATIESATVADNVAGRKFIIDAGNATAGGTSDLGGGDLFLNAGRGKGSASGGDIIFQSALAAGSSTNVNPYQETFRIKESKRVLILSGVNGSPSSINESLYADTNFFVSGSIGSRGTANLGTAVFGGDVVISGSLNGGSPLTIGNALLPSIDNTHDLGSASNAWKDIYLQGNIAAQDATTLSVASGDLTLDVAGDIILDADAGNWKFSDSASEKLRITNNNGDIEIANKTNDKNIVFKVNDSDPSGEIIAMKINGAEGGMLEIEADTIFKGGLETIKFGNNPDGTKFRFTKTRNADPLNNTVIQDGDSLGQVSFEGNDGSGSEIAALIETKVDGSPGNNDMPGKLEFSTTPDSTNTPATRMTIRADGSIEHSQASVDDAGTGFFHNDATLGVIDSFISEHNGVICTTFRVKIGKSGPTGFVNSIAAAPHILGDSNDAGNAYMTQINTTTMGVIYKVEMFCVEAPADIDADIDLWVNSTQQPEGANPNAGGTNKVQLIEAQADWKVGTFKEKIAQPNDAWGDTTDGINDYYVYLATGNADGNPDDNGPASAGQFVIRFYGVKTF